MTKGEVHTNRTEKAEALQASFSKLLANTEQLSDLLDEDMPELVLEEVKGKDDDLDEAEADAIVEESALGSLWEDEETKCFYENLKDLKAFIPAILYKDSSQQVSDASVQSAKELEAQEEMAEEENIEEELEVQDVAEEEIAPPDLEGGIELYHAVVGMPPVVMFPFQTKGKNKTIRIHRRKCSWMPSWQICLRAYVGR